MTDGQAAGADAGDRFRWHPAARLFGSDGAEVPAMPDRSARPPSVLDPDDGAQALAAALWLAAQGRAFRIGALDQPAPKDADPPRFETLTSGTSGGPRRICRTHASWTASFAVNARLFGLGPAARVAALGRLSHSLALYAGAEALHLGAALHLLDRLRPDRQRRALADLGITHLYATPAQLRLLCDGTARPALTGLGHIILGGSKLDPHLRAALSTLAPVARVVEFYGAAETSFITLSDAQHPPDTVGAAYPGVALAIRDAAGHDLPDGEPGTVWVRSPYGFAGYGDGAPGPARRDQSRDGSWLSVGEVGTLRGGVLTLHGRAGRMVTIADQNVFPEEIEAFLSGLGLARVAVLPRPDALRGTVLVAVTEGEGSPERTEALLRAARARFGPLKAPRAILWRTDWPTLAAGKPDLARLAADLGGADG